MLILTSFQKMRPYGCILKYENDLYIVDELETKKAREKVKDLVNKLYKKK